jgi:hypothetical protein
MRTRILSTLRLSRLERTFTVLKFVSLVAVLALMVIRLGVYDGRLPEDGHVGYTSIGLVWLSVTTAAAITGTLALIAGGRAQMLIPYIVIGMLLLPLSAFLVVPYRSPATLEQLLAAQCALYAATWVLWFGMLKVPLPRLGISGPGD